MAYSPFYYNSTSRLAGMEHEPLSMRLVCIVALHHIIALSNPLMPVILKMTVVVTIFVIRIMEDHRGTMLLAESHRKRVAKGP